MSDLNHPTSDLIYQLDDKPPFFQALLGAVTHLLALFVPMVMPDLIVGKALDLSADTTAYLVSMVMIASAAVLTFSNVPPSAINLRISFFRVALVLEEKADRSFETAT